MHRNSVDWSSLMGDGNKPTPIQRELQTRLDKRKKKPKKIKNKINFEEVKKRKMARAIKGFKHLESIGEKVDRGGTIVWAFRTWLMQEFGEKEGSSMAYALSTLGFVSEPTALEFERQPPKGELSHSSKKMVILDPRSRQ